MSFIPTRPPTTYVNMRLVDDMWCSLPAARKTKLNAFASMLPHCAAHMLRTISLHFFRAPLNGCRFWDGLIVFQGLARFTTSKPPTSILWYATLDIPTFWCDMRFEELWATWPSISLSHKSDPRVSAFGTLHHIQASNKHSVVCHLGHPNLLVWHAFWRIVSHMT